MKAAITGGSGFLGTAIYKELLRRGQEVVLFDRSEPPYALPQGVRWRKCDVSNVHQVKAAMDEEKPDHLYLLAGMLGTTELTYQPVNASRVNVGGVSSFMQILAEGGSLPRTFYVTKPSAWENMYTITKDAANRIMKFYSMKNEDGSSVTGLKNTFELVLHKWFNAYGPGQHTHPVRKAVPYMILSALANRPIRIHGNGEQTADYIHIDDIAKIAVHAMNQEKVPYSKKDGFLIPTEMDIGTGVPISVNQLVETIVRLTESKSEIIHDHMRSGETPDTELVANPVHINKIMGAGQRVGYRHKFVDFEDGMWETIQWYKALPESHKQEALEFYDKTAHSEEELRAFFTQGKAAAEPSEEA